MTRPPRRGRAAAGAVRRPARVARRGADVGAVETPPPPAPPAQPAQRRCPRCGSALTGEQEWCLECGASVGATIVAPPSWRGPVALVAVLLAVAAIAALLSLVQPSCHPD